MFPDGERYAWLEGHTRTVIERCHRVAAPLTGCYDSPKSVYVPGGDDKYPSFWIRDAVMTCASGLVPSEDIRDMLEIILAHQNGPKARKPAHGLRIDPWAIPDHINLPGLGVETVPDSLQCGAVFYPGTYSPSDDQGDGSFGLRAADDDIYEVIELARLILEQDGDVDGATLLRTQIRGMSIIERLDRGFRAMRVDEETGLPWNSSTNWAAANFHDALRPLGGIALTAVLRYRAACALARLFGLIGNGGSRRAYDSTAERIAGSVVKHLTRDDGWLIAATEVDRQPDVWSTSRAIYEGLLRGEPARKACEAMLAAYQQGTVAAHGYLRHTPTTADVQPGIQVWEHEEAPGQGEYGVYQNGGYWPQPLGYFCYALAQVDVNAARELACSFIDHTREHAEDGAPYEWLNPDIPLPETPRLGRWYGPSAALPLQGFRRLSGEGA